MTKMKFPKHFRIYLTAIIATVALTIVAVASAAVHGAIYTTTADGTEVNQNIYGDSGDVYLNGGPNNDNARGLPPGTYYFQVTDPSGKVLLSLDEASCRQLTVNTNGRVDGSTGPGCRHDEGFDVGSGTKTVQLSPFDETPNRGGEYKVWLIPVGEATVAPEDARFLNFKNKSAKTDNYKVIDGGGDSPE